MKSKWLDWTPESQVAEQAAPPEPTKPTKTGSVGFVGDDRGLLHTTSCSESPLPAGKNAPMSLEQIRNHPLFCPPKVSVTPESGVPGPSTCPPLPNGVQLVRYEPKTPPVAIDVCSVVYELDKFIAGELRELDARLHSPVQIRGGHGVFTTLERLRQVGLELEISASVGIGEK